MGTDMHGAIEICQGGTWHIAEDLPKVLDDVRDYDLFGCLFGVWNFANFHLLFPNRGIPKDSRLFFCYHQDEDANDASWCSYQELLDVNWDEPAVAPDERIHEFEVVDRIEVYRKKASWSSNVEGLYKQILQEGEVRKGNSIYRRVVLTGREVLPGLESALMAMEEFAQDIGPNQVRLVVYFES